MLFNRNAVKVGRTMEAPTTQMIQNTLGLVNASVEDAIRYGGEVTRAALSAIDLKNNRSNVIVDVKVHMLMAGMCPAIPGWHTDGVPRNDKGDPQGDRGPMLQLQEEIDAAGRAPHYHLIVTGEHCPTTFFTLPNFDWPDAEKPGQNLYKEMTKYVNSILKDKNQHWLHQYVKDTQPGQVLSWDWWNIHTGILARTSGWRYLIRVTETDFITPGTDLRKVIRTQQQVYTQQEFGW